MAWMCSANSNAKLVENLASVFIKTLESGIIHSERVISTMKSVDRGSFSRLNPYEDSPQSIGHNATISAPHMHGYALQALEPFLKPGAKALDIGSGTGYLTCCMAEMVGEQGKAVGIEHVPELVRDSIASCRKARPDFLTQGRLEFHVHDGREGWKTEAPYDAIHVGAAAYPLPPQLISQLKAPGRLIIPVGQPFSTQFLMQIDKDANGNIHESSLMGVRYVPLTSLHHQLA